jgi:dipeptidase
MSSVPVKACTTMLIAKGASADGSVIVAHSDDSELFDQRLVYVPAADHKPGALRYIYYDACSLGNRPEYHGYAVNHYVGTERGPTYIDPNRPQNILPGFNQKLISYGLGAFCQNMLYLYLCLYFFFIT